MKIRIGVGTAGGASTPDALAELVAGLDELGFDSLWLSEVLTGPVLDPAVLERCGRLSDGWLPSLCTPEEAAAGRVVIEEATAKAGRAISGEHFGMSIGYASAPIDPATARVMTSRRPRSLELTPVGLPALRERIQRFVDVGFSKFVVRPVAPPVSWRAELEALSGAVGDLQT